MTPSSPPANLWGHLAAKAARLELAVGLLSLTVLLLGGTLAWQAWHGLPVHYIPPGGPGVSQPGVIPDAVASFGGAVLLGAGVYLAKRGRPPGALLHRLHALELTRLPGVLSPRRQRYSAW